MPLKNEMYEEMTLSVFKATTNGKIVEALLIIVPVLSIIISYKLGINIILALILGFFTRSILGAISDIIISKVFRLDKQFAWLVSTHEGLDHLQKIGVTVERIEEIKKELGLDAIDKL